MSEHAPIPYAELRPRMKTGDLLRVSGSGMISKGIEIWTGPTSHVAMILRIDLYDEERVYITQATFKRGVHFVPLSSYLANLKGRAWWVPLNHERAALRNAELKKALIDLKPYPHRLIKHALRGTNRLYGKRWVLSYVLPFIRGKQENRYCSMLVADLLNRTALRKGPIHVPPDALWREYGTFLPNDVALIDPPPKVALSS